MLASPNRGETQELREEALQQSAELPKPALNGFQLGDLLLAFVLVG